MQKLETLLPLILLAISVLLKFSVNRTVDGRLLAKAFFELAVDVIFLALSFSVAFTIADLNNQTKGLPCVLIQFGVSVVVILCWRIIDKLHNQNVHWMKYGWLVILNTTIASIALVYSIALFNK